MSSNPEEVKAMDRILDTIKSPEDLRKLSLEQLPQLAGEVRDVIIDTVSKTGGHLATNLGSVELTLALHYCLNTPEDTILFDVGHQAYTHKLLTGRQGRFNTLRQEGGISGFPDKGENPAHDLFTVGHSSTSISWALGLTCGREIKKSQNGKVAVVIGDASLAGGMAFEAMNHTGHLQKNLIVVLNDNELSISPSIGALSRYLNQIVASPAYNRIRKDVEKMLKHVPWFGFRSLRAAKRVEKGLKNLLVPGMFFEDLGFRYFGPISGHDIPLVINTLNNVMNLDEPVLIHLLTKKGRGYRHAENYPSQFHSAKKFEICTGTMACATGDSYTGVFGKKMVELAKADPLLVAITAAMPGGTGLEKFAQEFPDRFFDTGIAEEHAVGFAAGLAREGLHPVVAIYSTFLQRGFDQIIHDVCLQNLPVTFALDRAGFVSDDGPTHNGVFDIAYLRLIPNMVVMAPSDGNELRAMLDCAQQHQGPCAIRYPKECVPDLGLAPDENSVKVGKSRLVRKGKDMLLLSYGSLLGEALLAAQQLMKTDIYAEVIDARFAKPLDVGMLNEAGKRFRLIVTIEDGALNGGFGSAVNEYVQNNIDRPPIVQNLGIPDTFLKHAKRESLLKNCGLDADGIAEFVRTSMKKHVFK